MPPENSNHDKLREAGLIGDELNPQHDKFIAELSEEEVDALVSIKGRLDEWEIPTLTLAPDPQKIMFMPIL
jgi:hypothetical protein